MNEFQNSLGTICASKPVFVSFLKSEAEIDVIAPFCTIKSEKITFQYLTFPTCKTAEIVQTILLFYPVKCQN